MGKLDPFTFFRIRPEILDSHLYALIIYFQQLILSL